MGIRQATLSDTDIVKDISEKTISEIYLHYYPEGAVSFFLELHSEEKIAADIKLDRVFIYLDESQDVVGTVTIKDDEICRLFVLPQHQERGHGTELLDFAEDCVAQRYSTITLATSLPAKALYLKRGYKEEKFETIRTYGDDFLCYDIMKKLMD